MNTLLSFLAAICSLAISYSASAQGWVAEIDLDLNHELYAYEKIETATISFSGVTVTGSSPASTRNFVISGTDPMSGDLMISASGIAWDPYDPGDPASEHIAVTHNWNYTAPCATGVFESKGRTVHEQILVRIIIYPRMDISTFLQDCDKLTLTTHTCSGSFFWEVSDDLHGNFKSLDTKTTASITITREELVALGFSNPFGRKYFRVTGRYKTTSQLQPVDMYYPGPSALLSPSPPKCNDGKDGTVAADIKTSAPSEINDFVVTLFRKDSPAEQKYLQSQSIVDFSGLASGYYTLKIENNSNINVYGSCWTEHSFTIAEPEAVVIASASITDFNGFQVSCSGASDAAIKVTPAGGTGFYEDYLWSPSISADNHAEQLSPGRYSLKVKDSNGCWSPQYDYEIRAPEALAVSMTSAGGKNGYDVSCFDKADGKILTEAAGGVQPYTFDWSDGSELANRTDMGPGSFRLKVRDANNCEASESIVLIAPDPIQFSVAELVGIECPGGNSGVLEIQSVTNTIGQVQYGWSSGENAIRVENKSAGTYYATVSDAQGCSGMRTVVLENPVVYTLSIRATSDYNGQPVRCYGEASGGLEAIVLDEAQNAIPITKYTWYLNGEVFISGMQASAIRNAPAGTYRAEATYREVCKAESTFILTQPKPVEVSIEVTADYNGAAISCAGAQNGSIAAQARGGVAPAYTFSWNTGEMSSQLTNIGPGEYVVTVTDKNGCSATRAMEITEPDTLKTTVEILSDYNGLPISCADAADARLKAVTTGGTYPILFSWNDGDVRDDRLDVPSGDYRVVATDANGCRSSASVTLINPSPVTVTIDHSNYNGYGVSCHDAADGFVLANGEGGTGKYTYQWGSAGEDPLLSNLPANIYRVTVEDQNGCQSTASHVITEPPPLALMVENPRHVTCNGGSDGEITLRSSGGTGNYSYSLSDKPWQSEPVWTSLVAREYLATVRDANGCMATTDQTISEPAPLTIRFDNVVPALCGDPRGEASASVGGGTPPYQLEWKNYNNEIVGKGVSVARLPSGIFLLSVTDQSLCRVQASIGIPATDGPAVQDVQIMPATCSYSSDGSAVLHAEGKEPLVYRWPNGEATPYASNLPKGEYLVEVTDSENCTTVASLTIPAPDSLTVHLIESVPPSCHGYCDGKLTAKASGGNGEYEYHWAVATGPSLKNICAGEYELNVTDARGCASEATFTLLTPASIELGSAVLKSPWCADDCNGAIALSANGGVGKLSYAWSTGEEGSMIDSLCAGTYAVTILDANECSAVRTFELYDPEKPTLDLGDSVILCEGQSHTLDAGPNWKSYSWTGPAPWTSSDRRVTISKAGPYWLTAVDNTGCVARDTFLLKSSRDLLHASFLLASKARVRDTVVLIDVSWPLPENTAWILPSEAKRLDDFGDVLFAQFETSGRYEVALSATLGECRDVLTKNITILDDTVRTDNGRLGHETFVREFSIYPNPNKGEFNIVVNLLRESPISITIWNLLTSRKVARWDGYGSKNYLKNLDLRPLNAGAYSVRLDYGKGTRYLRFIVE